jgi:hypothetical protein
MTGRFPCYLPTGLGQVLVGMLLSRHLKACLKLVPAL